MFKFDLYYCNSGGQYQQSSAQMWVPNAWFWDYVQWSYRETSECNDFPWSYILPKTEAYGWWQDPFSWTWSCADPHKATCWGTLTRWRSPIWRDGTRLHDCSWSCSFPKGEIVWSKWCIQGPCVWALWVDSHCKSQEEFFRVQGVQEQNGHCSGEWSLSYLLLQSKSKVFLVLNSLPFYCSYRFTSLTHVSCFSKS